MYYIKNKTKEKKWDEEKHICEEKTAEISFKISRDRVGLSGLLSGIDGINKQTATSVLNMPHIKYVQYVPK